MKKIIVIILSIITIVCMIFTVKEIVDYNSKSKKSTIEEKENIEKEIVETQEKVDQAKEELKKLKEEKCAEIEVLELWKESIKEIE
jgi:HPt (histidine-containing phosphotransfer) domain-containing protein